jgi:hypothetical protein
MDTGIGGTESRGNSICPIVSVILVPYRLVQYPSKMPRIFLRKLQKLPRKLQNEGGLEGNRGVQAASLPLTGWCGVAGHPRVDKKSLFSHLTDPLATSQIYAYLCTVQSIKAP